MPARRSANERDGWDVYALTAAPLPSRLRVLGMSFRVHVINGVAVLLAPPGTAPPALADALRRQHEIVLALSHRLDPLLPVRFGTRMTIGRLVEAVRSSSDELAEALEHVRGRRQMTLRVIGPPGESRNLSPATTGGDYLRQRRTLRMVPPEAAPLIAAVAPFVVDERVQAGRARIRASIFHLVERRAAAAYRRAATRAMPRVSPWRATVTGPWPPFAFGPEFTG